MNIYKFCVWILCFIPLYAVSSITCPPENDLLYQVKLDEDALKTEPNNVSYMYYLGKAKFCLEDLKSGAHWMGKAASRGHIHAAYLMGVYYKTNKTMDPLLIEKHHIENYTAMIFYFQKAAKLIEDNPNYPKNIHPDNHRAEQETYISFFVFTYLPALYFSGYYASMQNILPALDNNKILFHKDSLQTLQKALRNSLRCLKRPSLTIWGDQEETLSVIMKKICTITKNFVKKVYPLEEERLQKAKKCNTDIKQCPAYRKLTQKILRIAQSTDNLLTLNSLDLFF